jgi:hypothetical protein
LLLHYGRSDFYPEAIFSSYVLLDQLYAPNVFLLMKTFRQIDASMESGR